MIIFASTYTIFFAYFGKKVYLILFRPQLNNLEFLNRDRSIRTTINSKISIAEKELKKRQSRNSSMGPGGLHFRRHSSGSPLPSGKTIENSSELLSNSKTTIASKSPQNTHVENCYYKVGSSKFKCGYIHVIFDAEHIILSENDTGENGRVLAMEDLSVMPCNLYDHCILIASTQKFLVKFQNNETQKLIWDILTSRTSKFAENSGNLGPPPRLEVNLPALIE
eukprot:NODE_21_length_42443_cov_0.822808.p26 type:complete len:223 gc:universal NODE_21_length_42443_cov_0.822808:41330-40662(-)